MQSHTSVNILVAQPKRGNHSKIAKDSELPTELLDSQADIQNYPASTALAQQSDDDSDHSEAQMRFVLSAERYLVGNEIRGLVHLDGERYGAVSWNENKVHSIDRQRPDAVI